MAKSLECIKAFICSPHDVAKERKIVEKVIKDISTSCKDVLGLEIESISWEKFPPQTTKLPEVKIQNFLNSKIKECKIFILILWKRYGSVEEGENKSNTEREVKVALDLLKSGHKIIFLSYFKNLSDIHDKGPQREKVEVFRDSLESQGVWYKPFNTSSNFQELLTHDLYRTIINYRLSTSKQLFLNKFWEFGIPDRQTYPNLAIIYPSMERTFMGQNSKPDLWLKRLEPNMVFEDVKALQKVEKTLRLIGYTQYRIYNTAFMPDDLHFMNRFWICLPRNPMGIEQLKKYKDVSRFNIVSKTKRENTHILWKDKNNDEFFTIHSPLAKYLYTQRKNMEILGNWKFEMDRIIAKDFAVLARFRDAQNHLPMEEYYLIDYFLSGIRGLGTWGAAWYIDNKYQQFEKINEKEDFQLLLEIDYRDGRIFDVNDVSDEPMEYFEKQNDIKEIKRTILNFKKIHT